MRTIDADALKDNMLHYAAPEMVWDRGDIEHKINEMPTIEAIPVEWLWAAQNKMLNSPRYNFEQCAVVGQLIRAWQKEQEEK